jgi:hypothetical protein
MKVFVVGQDENCGFCNWKTQTLYLLADTEEQAQKIYSENERGLCADCLMQDISGGDYDIVKP